MTRTEILISNFIPGSPGAAVTATGGGFNWWWLLLIAAAIFLVYLYFKNRQPATQQ